MKRVSITVKHGSKVEEDSEPILKEIPSAGLYGAKGLVTATYVQRRNRSRIFLNFCLKILYN